MAVTAYIATRLEPAEAEALEALAQSNAHSLSAEVRVAIRRHLAVAAETLNGARPAGRPGDAEPTPIAAAEAIGAR